MCSSDGLRDQEFGDDLQDVRCYVVFLEGMRSSVHAHMWMLY